MGGEAERNILTVCRTKGKSRSKVELSNRADSAGDKAVTLVKMVAMTVSAGRW